MVQARNTPTERKEQIQTLRRIVAKYREYIDSEPELTPTMRGFERIERKLGQAILLVEKTNPRVKKTIEVPRLGRKLTENELVNSMRIDRQVKTDNIPAMVDLRETLRNRSKYLAEQRIHISKTAEFGRTEMDEEIQTISTVLREQKSTIRKVALTKNESAAIVFWSIIGAEIENIANGSIWIGIMAGAIFTACAIGIKRWLAYEHRELTVGDKKLFETHEETYMRLSNERRTQISNAVQKAAKASEICEEELDELIRRLEEYKNETDRDRKVYALTEMKEFPLERISDNRIK